MAVSSSSTLRFCVLIVSLIIGWATSGSMAQKRFGARGFTAGGYSLADVDDAVVKEMANFATTAISASSNSGPLSLIKIVKAESQVVAGRNFKLILELNNIGHNSEEENLVCEVIVFDQSWTNTRHVNQSSCLPTRVIHSWTKSRDQSESTNQTEMVPVVEEAETPLPPVGTDLVAEILRAIDGHTELWRVADYLNASREELAKAFPLISRDGVKLKYTFFAPTASAFMMQTPQDVGDPLVMDSDFRQSILTRHLARSFISPDDLANLYWVFMASKAAKFTRKSTKEECNLPPIEKGDILCSKDIPVWMFQSDLGTCESYDYRRCGQTANLFETKEACRTACDPAIYPLTNLINGAEIEPVAIPLAHDLGMVYVINRVFMDGDEVSNILSKHPSRGYGFLGLPTEAIPVDSIDVIDENTLAKSTGSFIFIRADDGYVKDIAEFAIAAMSVNWGCLRLVRIVKADEQNADGNKHKLTLELNRVGVEGDDGEGLLCDAFIFDQPWTNTRQLSESSCLPIKTITLWNKIYNQNDRFVEPDLKSAPIGARVKLFEDEDF